MKPNQFVTPHGVSEYPGDWSDELKAVARMNFLWEHVTPEDVTALLEVSGWKRTFTPTGPSPSSFSSPPAASPRGCGCISAPHEICGALGCKPGAPLPAASLVTAFFAHTLKWPPAVRHLKSLVAERPPTGPIEVMRLYREVLEWCDGNTWPDMFYAMNSGLMHAQTGAAVHGVELGLLRAVKAKRLMGKVDSGMSPGFQLPAASPAAVQVQHVRWRLFEGAPGASWMFSGMSWEASRGPVGGPLGACLGDCGGPLGILLGVLGGLLGPHGGVLGQQDRIVGVCSPSWASQGFVLGQS